MRKDKRVLMPFAFREGILTGLLVLMFFTVSVVALMMYVMWSGSGNAICLLFSFLSIIVIVILVAISSRSRWKRG